MNITTFNAYIFIFDLFILHMHSFNQSVKETIADKSYVGNPQLKELFSEHRFYDSPQAEPL